MTETTTKMTERERWTILGEVLVAAGGAILAVVLGKR